VVRNVWTRVKRNAGVAGSNQCVGEHLTAWAEARGYSPAIELAGLPGAVSNVLAKAGGELRRAAQAEAAAILERDPVRTRSELLALWDALKTDASREAVLRQIRIIAAD
jgi:hypothetical protein